MADNSRNIIAALRHMQKSEGWAIIEKVLMQNIHQTRLELDGKVEKIESIEELRVRQGKIEDRRRLILLPDEIIGDLKRDPSKEPRFDPYYTDKDLEEELAYEKEELNPDTGKHAEPEEETEEGA